MKSVYRYILILVSPFLLLAGFFVYLITGKTPDVSYKAMIVLFCATQGKSSDFLNSIISLFRPAYKKIILTSGITGELKPGMIDKITAEIKENGYCIFPERLSKDVCDRLMKFALTEKPYIRPHTSEESEKTLRNERIQVKFNQKKFEAVRYDYYPDQLLRNNDVQRLLADSTLLQIAQNYLGCKPVSDVLSMWWHTAFTDEPNPEAATMYHFDMDRIKWLKIFVYLTDVTEESGAHCFIQGSHKSGAIPSKFLKRGYARLTDEEVLSYYGKEREIVYAAPRGSIILEDTRGLHKGKAVKKDSRLILQIQYSDLLFGAHYSKTFFPEEICTELQDQVRSYPSTYKSYL